MGDDWYWNPANPYYWYLHSYQESNQTFSSLTDVNLGEVSLIIVVVAFVVWWSSK